MQADSSKTALRGLLLVLAAAGLAGLWASDNTYQHEVRLARSTGSGFRQANDRHPTVASARQPFCGMVRLHGPRPAVASVCIGEEPAVAEPPANSERPAPLVFYGRALRRVRIEAHLASWWYSESYCRSRRQVFALWRSVWGWGELMTESLLRSIERIRWTSQISSGEQAPRL